jgi:hypothetical protein
MICDQLSAEARMMFSRNEPVNVRPNTNSSGAKRSFGVVDFVILSWEGSIPLSRGELVDML